MIPMTGRKPMREHKKQANKKNCAARRLFFDGRERLLHIAD